MATKKRNSTKKNSKLVSAKSSGKVSSLKQLTVEALMRRNIILAAFLFLQAVLIFVLANGSSVPITADYLAKDSLASAQSGATVFAPASKHLFDLSLAALVVSFLLVSAIMKLLVATRYRNSYETALKQKVNSWRWTEVGVTAGLMLVTIAVLNGMRDISSLVMIFGLVAVLHFLAYIAEGSKAPGVRKTQWLSYVALFSVGAVVWVAVDGYLKSALIYGDGLPNYVYFINASIFLVTIGLAAVLWKSLKGQGKWSNYVYGESAFIFLSVIAQTALAWQVYAGALHG